MDFSLVDDESNFALHLACIEGYVDVTKVLIEQGKLVDVRCACVLKKCSVLGFIPLRDEKCWNYGVSIAIYIAGFSTWKPLFTYAR